MPPKPESIALQLELDTRAAEKSAKRFEGVVKSTTNETERAFEASQKSQYKAVSKFYTSMTKGRKIVAQLDKQQKVAGDHMHKTLRATKQDYKNVEKEILKAEAALRDLALAEKDGSSARNKGHKDQIAQARERMKQLDEQKDALEKLRKSSIAAYDNVREAKEKAQDKFGLDTDKLIDAAAEAGAELVEPFTAMLEKDWQKAMKSGAKLLGNGVGLAVKGAGKAIQKVGNRPGGWMQSMGSKLSDKGKAMGGMGGGMAKGAGGALSGLGGMMKGIGPLIQSVAKLGPVLGMMAGAVAGLVKLFLDADAQVKDFNKDVLASASTTNYLYRNMGNAGAAAREMADDLKAMRDQAFSFDSVMQGLSKEDFTTVLGGLAEGGVDIHNVANEFARAQKAGEAYTKVFSNNTQMAVAYARTMGVSLGEVTSFQAEMMTDVGASVGGVADSFEMMSRVAADAGIAQNKFFGMIRSVSSDLSLYNTRLDDTVHLLGLLGKVMSPKSAQKFMQSVTGAMKGAGRIGRLKMNLLTGGAMGGMVEKDLGRKSKGVAEEINRQTGKNVSGKDVMSGDVNELLKGVADEQQGALRESIFQMRLDAKKNKKGIYGQSLAAKNLSPGASLDAMTKSVGRFGGSGDIGFEQMAENMGWDEEMTDKMMQVKEAIDAQRDSLKNQLGKGGQESLDALAAIQKAGIDAKTVEEAQGKLASMSYDELMATMDKSGQNTVKEMAGTRDLAKEQADNTTSLLAKFDRFFEFFTNQFYNLIQKIYEGIMSIPGVGKAGSGEDLAFSKKVRGIKDADVQEALGKAGSSNAGNLEVATRDNLVGSEGMKVVQRALHSKVDLPHQAEQSGVRDLMNNQLDTPDKLLQAMKAAGLDTTKVTEALGGATGSDKINTADVLGKAGLQGDDLTKLADKSVWFMDPATFATMFPAFKEMSTAALGGATATPTPGAAPAKGGAPVPAAPGAPTPAAAKAPPTSPAGQTATATATTATAADKQVEQNEVIGGTLGDIEKALRQKGIVLDKSQWKSRIQEQMDKGTLDSLRTALYEYYLYKDVSLEQMQKAVQAGLSPSEVGSYVSDSFSKGTKPGDALGQYQKNAEGGMVTGIVNGMAQVRRIPTGEGLASIGPGERILPAGGGGGGGRVVVELSLKDDLGRIIDARASDVYARNQSQSRLR